MFCEKCGNPLPGNTAFCSNCGNPTKGSTPAPQAPAPYPTAPAPAASLSAWEKHKPLIIIGIVFAAIVVAFLLLSGNLFGGIVGTWELVEQREYTNGHLGWHERLSPEERRENRVEFNRNGTGVFIYQLNRDYFDWETRGRELTIFEHGHAEVFEFRISGNEMRWTLTDSSWGDDTSTFVIILQRAR
ncbi:MAG: zinc ribbon domain-containing protein [Defluviitaleaceae bacterium]|nr:zinc ribbon domain-containing protein [Defluviitaleaceae bacterium]MCL2240750.1 zinc ribbon domain-containing protein [Defluviitaleaceae bacterium]